MMNLINNITLYTLFFLGLTFQAVCFAKIDNPWSELYIKDIDFIKFTLKNNHPGSIDKNNPEFNQWLESGHKKALINAKKIKDYDGLFFGELEYINGFQDGHLALQFQIKRDTYYYPGIVIKKIDKSFIVSESEIKEVPVYSELLSCNNKSPRQLLDDNILPFFGLKNLEASDMLVTPYLLVERFNPLIDQIKLCQFKLSNGQIIDHQLNYSPVSKSYFEIMANKAAFGNPPEHFSLRKFGEGYWLTMPNFWPEGKEFENAKNIIEEFRKKITEIRNSKALVLDVRGNTGGSSNWGHEIAEILWGTNQLQLIESEMSKNEKVEWRISPDNIEHIKKMENEISTKFGKETPIAQYFKSTREGILLAKKNKELFYTQTDDSVGSNKNLAKNESTQIKTKIYFLTDGHCMSACLDFADYILANNNVTHIGLPTWADTNYMELRSVELPSKLAQLNFAIKVYRGRKRKSNQAYIPQIIWRDNSSNDNELEKWILDQK